MAYIQTEKLSVSLRFESRFLYRDRVAELVDMGPDLIELMQPVRAQRFGDEYIILKGFHETYAARRLELQHVPVEYSVEFEEIPFELTDILDMELVSKEEYNRREKFLEESDLEFLDKILRNYPEDNEVFDG